MTVADQLTRINDAKLAIKGAIEAKGVDMSGVTFEGYPDKILEIAGVTESWERPADWLALPAVTETDQKFVGLHAIYTDANFVALSAAGAYTVDWGDGTIENFAAAATAQHEYDYATYDTAGATLCARGYKQVIITVTPQAGQTLTTLNLHKRHASLAFGYNSGFTDIALASQYLTSLLIGARSTASSATDIQTKLLERVVVVKHAVTDMGYLFTGCSSLQSIQVDTTAVTNMSGLFLGCSCLQSFPVLNTSAVINITSMFQNCTSLTSVPTLDTSAATNMSYMFSGCAALQVAPTLDTSAVANMTNMFASCGRLQYIPALNTAMVTSAGGMFSGCVSLPSIPALNTAMVTSTSGMFSSCISLSSISVTGMKVSFSIANCKLSAARLNEIYSNLATVSGQTITVTGNYGAAADDPAIATAKGWTVTG